MNTELAANVKGAIHDCANVNLATKKKKEKEKRKKRKKRKKERKKKRQYFRLVDIVGKVLHKFEVHRLYFN